MRTAVPLYPKLRPRPNGLSRRHVIANQRARLHGALIETSALQSYDAISVAALCRLAGISKRTFYELYENKDECFLGCYERLMRVVTERAESAASSVHDPAAGLQEMFKVLAQSAVAEPAAARLIFAPSPISGRRAARRRALARGRLAEAVVLQLDRCADGWCLPTIVSCGLLAGVERVLQRCRAPQWPTEAIALELSHWALGYVSPALQALPGARATRPGPARPRNHEGPQGERIRVLRATVEMLASDGYDRLTAAAIGWRAGLPHRDPTAPLGGLDRCVLAALEHFGLEALIRAARLAGGDPPTWVEVHLALTALLDELAADRLLRAVAFAEVGHGGHLDAGRERLVHGFVGAFLNRMPLVEPISHIATEATAGALWGVVSHLASSATPDQLADSAPHIGYLALAPLLGPGRAVEAICEATAG